MGEQNALSIKDENLPSLHASADNSEKFQSVKRLELRFKEYASNYQAFLKNAEDLHDLSEKAFIENELTVFKDCQKVFRRMVLKEPLDKESTIAFYDNLTYVVPIFIAYLNSQTTFLNSSERKIKFLEEKLREINKSNKESEVSNSDNYDNDIVVLDITLIRHKLILLYELGIIEKLEKDHPIHLNGVNIITSLIQCLLNIPDAKPDSIRSELGKLRNNKEEMVLTPRAVKKVKSELAKIGILSTKRI